MADLEAEVSDTVNAEFYVTSQGIIHKSEYKAPPAVRGQPQPPRPPSVSFDVFKASVIEAASNHFILSSVRKPPR